jgi:predicted HicB family RNase H-like nuclease
MKLSEVCNTFDYRISGGSEYCWKCYGENARFLDFESEFGHGSVIFDSMDQTVFSAEISANADGEDNLPSPYRWLNPVWKDEYLAECKEKNIQPNNAWDDVDWIDLEVEEDWHEKANAIFNNIPFDRRIQVPINLDDSEMLALAMQAHERDITLNKMVEILLKQAIDNHRVNEVAE